MYSLSGSPVVGVTIWILCLSNILVVYLALNLLSKNIKNIEINIALTSIQTGFL